VGLVKFGLLIEFDLLTLIVMQLDLLEDVPKKSPSTEHEKHSK
jgi:hypothetical protein